MTERTFADLLFGVSALHSCHQTARLYTTSLVIRHPTQHAKGTMVLVLGRVWPRRRGRAFDVAHSTRRASLARTRCFVPK